MVFVSTWSQYLRYYPRVMVVNERLHMHNQIVRFGMMMSQYALNLLGDNTKWMSRRMWMHLHFNILGWQIKWSHKTCWMFFSNAFPKRSLLQWAYTAKKIPLVRILVVILTMKHNMQMDEREHEPWYQASKPEALECHYYTKQENTDSSHPLNIGINRNWFERTYSLWIEKKQRK